MLLQYIHSDAYYWMPCRNPAIGTHICNLFHPTSIHAPLRSYIQPYMYVRNHQQRIQCKYVSISEIITLKAFIQQFIIIIISKLTDIDWNWNVEKEQINDMNFFRLYLNWIRIYPYIKNIHIPTSILHRYPVLRMMGLVRDDTAKYKSFKSLNWIENSSNTL